MVVNGKSDPATHENQIKKRHKSGFPDENPVPWSVGYGLRKTPGGHTDFAEALPERSVSLKYKRADDY